jgi:uncharacterized protein
MTPSVAHFLLLIGAGALAGVVGAAGGITSLISFPALLAVGIPPLPATVTNSVALVACWPGSAIGSRPELRGQRAWLRSWSPVAVAGGAIGAGLLLSTSPGLFSRIVPFLVAIGSLILVLQPQISGWLAKHSPGAKSWLLPAGLLLLSAYNGYFGAGAGVMVLTLMLVTVDNRLPSANALKNMLIGVATLVSAIAFVLFGHLRWTAVAPLGLGMLVGSAFGPSVTRRVPAGWMRVLVALTGFGLALRLWIAPI